MTQLLILISTEGSEFKIITQDDIELIKEKEKKQGLACENSFCWNSLKWNVEMTAYLDFLRHVVTVGWYNGIDVKWLLAFENDMLYIFRIEIKEWSI